MKFDVIIGNPPYSDQSSVSSNTRSLDDTFFSNGIIISDYTSMIIRSKHFVNQTSSFRKQLFSTKLISFIEYLPDNTFPTVDVRTCVITYDKHHNGKTKIKTTTGEITYIDLSEDTIIHPQTGVLSSPHKNLATRWKRGKLYLNQVVESSDGVTFVKALGRKNDDIETCLIDPSLESFGYKQHGVMIPNMGTNDGKIGKVVVKPYEAVAGHSIVQFWTNTEEQAIQLADYLQSEYIKEFIKSIKFSNPNPKALFALIPDPIN